MMDKYTHWNIKIFLLSGQSLILTITQARLDTVLKELVEVHNTGQDYNIMDEKGAVYIRVVGKNIGSWMTTPVMQNSGLVAPNNRLLEMGR